MKSIWMRAGITLQAADEEIDVPLGENYDAANDTVKTILQKGRFNRNGLPTMDTFLRHMKEQPTAYCPRVYADYFATRQEERQQFIPESYKSWIRRNQRHPSAAEILQDRLPSPATIKTSFHCTAVELLQEHFPEYPSYLSSKEEQTEDGQEELLGMNMTL